MFGDWLRSLPNVNKRDPSNDKLIKWVILDQQVQIFSDNIFFVFQDSAQIMEPFNGGRTQLLIEQAQVRNLEFYRYLYIFRCTWPPEIFSVNFFIFSEISIHFVASENLNEFEEFHDKLLPI